MNVKLFFVAPQLILTTDYQQQIVLIELFLGLKLDKTS